MVTICFFILFYIVNLLHGFPKGSSHVPWSAGNSRKNNKNFKIQNYLIYTLYRPHTLDDHEREGSDEESSDSSGRRSQVRRRWECCLGTINRAFYDSHTTERKSREDAVPNSMIERDMVDRVLSSRGAAIPVQHHTIIFVGFVEEHRLICCIVNIHSVQ